MTPQLAFGISVVFGFLAWGLVARQYIWPTLREKSRTDALRPILMLHAFRFLGLSFIVPGVVSPDLPHSFAVPAALGDLATAVFALLSLATLKRKGGVALVWGFNLLGTVDLLRAFYEGNRGAMRTEPGLQGAAYFIPTALVPLLLITHGLVYRLLLRGDAAPVSVSETRPA